MLRMSFDQDMLENVEERLSVWVHAYANSSLYAWLGSCIHGQASCVWGLVHVCTCLFLSSCVHMFQPAYVCIVPMYTSLSLCAHTARQKPQLDYLNSFFSSVSHPIENLMPFFIIFASKCDPNIIFHRIVNLTSFCPLCVCVCVSVCVQILDPFSGRMSPSPVAAWFWLLTEETKVHVRDAGFESIINLLP